MIVGLYYMLMEGKPDERTLLICWVLDTIIEVLGTTYFIIHQLST